MMVSFAQAAFEPPREISPQPHYRRNRRVCAQRVRNEKTELAFRSALRKVMEEIPPATMDVVHQALAQLRAERERQGLSLADVAQRTGMTRENICRLESEERNVTLRTLQRYARGLGCNLVIELEPAKTKAKKRSAQIRRAGPTFQAWTCGDRPLCFLDVLLGEGQAITNPFSSAAEVGKRTARYVKWVESELSYSADKALLEKHYDVMVSEIQLRGRLR